MILMRKNEFALLTGTGFLMALFLSSVLATDISETAAVKMTDEDRLLEELFRRRHYNRDSTPSQRIDDVVDVRLTIIPKQLSTLDGLNEVMEMLVWIVMRWTDVRLAWNESDHSGLSRLSIPFSKLWIPDITLTNSAKQWTRWPEVNIMVSSDGLCKWAPPLMTVSYCPIDIRWFPFDEQRCLLEFESWSYDAAKLNITTGSTPVTDKHYRRNSEWDLVEISHNLSTILYYEPFVHLDFIFHWRRRTLFYGFNIILPCTLLSALSAVTFVIPPQSGERIGLGISTLLAMSVNQLIVADRVPPTSDAIPLLGVYFVGVLAANAVSLMAMVGVSNLYHRSSTNTHPIPDWVKTVVCTRLGKLLQMPKPSHNKQTRDNADCFKANPRNADQITEGKYIAATNNHDCTPSTDVADKQPPEGDDIHNDDWKYAALVIDRLCFYICIFYLTTITLAFYACVIAVRFNSL